MAACRAQTTTTMPRTTTSPEQAEEASEAAPFFTGDWAGQRNNFQGEAGISFRVNQDFTITELGRHINSDSLADEKLVTLWSTATRRAVAQILVGPGSSKDGNYAFAPLPQPFTVKSGEEYRLSQQCTRGMRERWFDGKDPGAAADMSDFATTTTTTTTTTMTTTTSTT